MRFNLRDGSLHDRLEFLLGAISLVAGLAILAELFPETWWEDKRFAYSTAAISDEIVLVGVDESYAERHGYNTDVPVAHLAAVMRAVTEYEPTAIALDFRLGPEEARDTAFRHLVASVSAAMERGIPVVIPTVSMQWAGQTEQARPLPSELAGVDAGIVKWSVPGDSPPYRLRSFPATVPLSENCHLLSFPLAAAAAHRRLLSGPAPCMGPGTLEDTSAVRILQRLGLSGVVGADIPIDYVGPVSGTPFSYFSSQDLIDQVSQGINLGQRRNRLYLVAGVFPDPTGKDVANTPFGVMRGGIVHLHAIDTLLRRPFLRLNGSGAAFIVSVAMFAGLLAAWKRWGLKAAFPAFGVLAAFVFSAFLVFTTLNVLIPIAWPLWAGSLATAIGFLVYGGPLNVSGTDAGTGERSDAGEHPHSSLLRDARGADPQAVVERDPARRSPAHVGSEALRHPPNGERESSDAETLAFVLWWVLILILISAAATADHSGKAVG